MATTTTLMTAAELLAMPDDGFHRYELVKGELITMPPAGGEHGAIGIRAAVRIGVFVEQNDLGVIFNSDTGFIVETDPDTVRAPRRLVRAEGTHPRRRHPQGLHPRRARPCRRGHFALRLIHRGRRESRPAPRSRNPARRPHRPAHADSLTAPRWRNRPPHRSRHPDIRRCSAWVRVPNHRTVRLIYEQISFQ